MSRTKHLESCISGSLLTFDEDQELLAAANRDIDEAVKAVAIPEDAKEMLALALKRIPASEIRMDDDYEKYKRARAWIHSLPVRKDGE